MSFDVAVKDEVMNCLTKSQTEEGKYLILDLDQKYFCQSSEASSEKRQEVLMALAETYLGKTVMNNGDSSEEEEGRPQTKSHYIPEIDDDQGDGSLAPFQKASKQKNMGK